MRIIEVESYQNKYHETILILESGYPLKVQYAQEYTVIGCKTGKIVIGQIDSKITIELFDNQGKHGTTFLGLVFRQ